MRHFYIKNKSLISLFLIGLAVLVFSERLSSKDNFLKTSDFPVMIVDDEGVALIGVNVVNTSGTFGAVTDLEGKVILKDIGYSEVLIFSYIGFESVRIPFYQLRQRGWKIIMRPGLDLLPSIVVVGRRDEKPEDIPYQIGIVTKARLEEYNSQTTADALMQNENVFVQKSQMGGGSINIRGFEANKVLLVVDGVRMNNIVYRNGHLQDAIKVDNNALEQIEVIYGPGSLNYGSDALGGVVQFRTKDPKLYNGEDPSKNYVSNSSGLSRFSSANREVTIHGDVNYGTEKWASFTSFSFANYQDLRAGANRPEKYYDFGIRPELFLREEGDGTRVNLDPNIQSPTGYSQFDLLEKVKYKPNKNQTFLLNFQLSTSSNVPRYDRLTETSKGTLKFADWYYGPQTRSLLSLKSQTFKRTKFFNKMTVIGAMQKIDEDRHSRKFGIIWQDINLENIYAWSLTTDFQKNFGSRAALIYGVDINHNLLKSSAEQLNINTEERRNTIPTRYPSLGSTMTILASYANYTVRSRDSVFTAFGGLRYTYTNLFARYDARLRDTEPFIWPGSFYNEGIGSSNGRLTWSIGGTINTKNGWQVKASASTAFHAPNIDDFAKFRDKNQNIRVPNDTLLPERTINGELTLGKSFGKMRNKTGSGAMVEISTYYTRLYDGIVQDAFTFRGDSTYLNPRDLLIYDVVSNQNKEQGYIYGTSGNFTLKIKKFEAYSGFGYSIGRIVEDGKATRPLDHIPPLFARGGLRYKNKFMLLSFAVRHNAWKRIEDYAPGEDNEEYATPEGTYAWTTYNLYSSFKVRPNVSIDASVENIMDIHYRPFSSGVSAAGRNFIIALRGKF